MTEPTSDRPRLFLLPGRDKRIRAGHPWAYSNEIKIGLEEKALEPGTVVSLHRVDGKYYGTGTFNPHALIAVRLYFKQAEQALDAAFFGERLTQAAALRDRLFDAPYYRLIHAEADGLPGLVVDRHGDVVVVQSGTAGNDHLMGELLSAVESVLKPKTVIVKSDTPARQFEGLDPDSRVVLGSLDGPIEIKERGLTFCADPIDGQKTGWFYDQRLNRGLVAGLAKDARVLDVYAHTGGFGVSAAANGASSVMCVDSSQKAIDLATLAAEKNGVANICTFDRSDAFESLEALAASKKRFDVVCVDPPAFAKSKKDVASALKGYRKLARLASRVVARGGLLFAASCSHNVLAERFNAEITIGCSRSERFGRILAMGGAGPDHPIHPQLPETAYLKSILLQLD